MSILKGVPCGNMPRATFERLERQKLYFGSKRIKEEGHSEATSEL